MGAGSWPTLVSVAATTLDALLHEKEIEEQAPLFAAVLSGEAKPQPPAFVDKSALEALPPQARKAADEALLMFDFLSKREGASLAPAFNTLLGAIDSACRAFVTSRLQGAMPAAPQDQRAWFDSYFSRPASMPVPHYGKFAQNVRKLLLFGAGMMPIGMLRNSLEYAHRPSGG